MEGLLFCSLLVDEEGIYASGTRGRAAAVEAVPVPKAQMMGRQDWRYVSGHANLVNYGTHPADTDVTSLAFSQDNLTLLSRAADDTLKVIPMRFPSEQQGICLQLPPAQVKQVKQRNFAIFAALVSWKTGRKLELICCNQPRQPQEDESTFFDGWWGVWRCETGFTGVGPQEVQVARACLRRSS